MNRVLLTGNLTNDFVVRSDKLATCSIAVNRDIGKGVEYIDLVAFNGFVENVKSLKKGTLVFVEGAWSSQTNNGKKYIQVVIARIEKIKGYDNALQQEGIEDTPSADVNVDDLPDDDLPF